MNYIEFMTLTSCTIMVPLAFTLRNPLQLFHIGVLFNTIPFLLMDYTGSNQLRVLGIPLSMLPHFVLLGCLLLRFNKRIIIPIIPIIFMMLFLAVNITNMSLGGFASISDYLYLFGLIVVVSCIHLLKNIVCKFKTNEVADFIKFSSKISLILVLCTFFSYIMGSDAQRGNPAIIMNRNLFSLFLIIYVHLNYLHIYNSEKSVYYVHIINFLLIFSIILIGSRAAILSIFAYLLIVNRYARISSVILFLIIGVVGVNFGIFDAKIIYRFSDAFFTLREVITAGPEASIDVKRIALFFTALEVLKDNWIFGIGAGVNLYKDVALPYSVAGYVASPHNLWLSLLISFGVLQTTFLLIFVRSILVSSGVRFIIYERALILALLVIWCFNQYILVPFIVLALSLIGAGRENLNCVSSQKNP